MKEIRFTGVLFLFLFIAVSAKQWKQDEWDKKHLAPQKGIHYQWPKHPKPHTEYWRTFHPHDNEKQTKEITKQSHHSISHHESEFQSHFKPNRKHNQKHYRKWEREDLHLQDLNLERQIKENQRAHRGSHSQHNDKHHEVERVATHRPGHLKEPWTKHEHNKHIKAFTHTQVDHHHSHHKNHKGNHHKYHKQGDKSMKNKRKKAHEKKFNKKHNKKHFVW